MPNVDKMNFISRCIKVLTSPYEFFKTKFTPDLGTPALHVTLVGIITALFLTTTLLLGIIIIRPPELMNPLILGFIIFASLIQLIIAPLLILMGWFTGGLINHLFVLLVGGKGGWKRTLKVVAYTSTTNILTPIPLIGIIISGIYSLYLTYVGYKKQHELSSEKAAMAVLLPLILSAGMSFFPIIPLLLLNPFSPG